MGALSFLIRLAALFFPTVALAEIRTFTGTHTYILSDHDSKDDARQRCWLEAKRKILEQVGVYIESVSEVKNFDLTKDKITSFAATVMQVKATEEDMGFQQGHMTLTLKLTTQVDLAEVRKHLAARQLDAGVREDVAAQKEWLTKARQQWWEQAAAKGDAKAQVFLGMMHENGGGVPQDYAKARQWYEQAAAQGHVMAQSNLGQLHCYGQGVPQDYAKARQWLEQAAAQGDAKAQYYLGVLYAEGKGVRQDYATAREWYEKAAAQGSSNAQFNLGGLYAEGKGVRQDYAEARQWYEKSAAHGDAGAQYNLGQLYYDGQGVPQDYAKARQWYERAAIQGHAKAQNNLGGLYTFGEGVPKDDIQAYMWLNLAAAHSMGDEQNQAADNRDVVARRMTPAQIAEAQKLSQEWKPNK